MRQEHLKAILEKGILAPSADNLQPWKFRFRSGQWDLLIDTERVKSYCDAGWLMPYLSAGAVLENMRITAEWLGYEMHVSYFPNSEIPWWVAAVDFSVVEHKGGPLFDFLDRRVTNRKFYRFGKEMPESVMDRIYSFMMSKPGFKMRWFENGDPSFSRLAALVGKAEQLRFEIRRLHRELMEIFRFTPEEAVKTRDGLDIRTLESDGSSVLFPFLRSWKRMRLSNYAGMSHMFGFYAWLQMMSSSSAGFLYAADREPKSYVKGGELMQRIWLELAREGLSVQPMEALPIFIVNLQVTGGQDLQPDQLAKLRSWKEEFETLWGMKDSAGPLMLFRVGYAGEPGVRTLRRPLNEFLMDESQTALFHQAGSRESS